MSRGKKQARSERRMCRSFSESTSLAARELQRHVERQPAVFLGIGIHVVKQSVGVGGQVVAELRVSDSHEGRPAEMNLITAVQRIVLRRLDLSTGRDRAAHE